MNHKTFEMHLEAALHRSTDIPADQTPGPDLINSRNQGHMDAVIWELKKEVVKKRSRKRIGFSDFLLLQIKMTGWKIWLLQGMMFLGFVFLITAILGPYIWLDHRYTTKLLCYFSILISMTALPFLHRSVHYKMQEVEAATRFSSMRLLLAKMLLLGIGDVFLLNMVLITAALRTSIYTGSLVLYLLFPFLLANGGALFLIGHLNAGHFLQGSLAFYTLLITLVTVVRYFSPAFFQQTLSSGWLAACAGMTVFCIWQLRYIIYRSSYSEMQLN
ncbi:hypothetical protein HGO97_015460 [Faecalicatena sp. AGMB00832]|uniref:ABC-2 family transporter n=1 Tax=Faecalicatena faecalis TaxID=2726362 RepID=A0ABS6D6H4_9FIRM|nr:MULTISPECIES: hypothetical protein [Faecalicatena]MBU3877202.1 hypothetical protein [Faecalicatena faecalis]MCI6467271.1 hypothetical protein [Faecalicatena sp.]MDY5620276.1 hypothetical protein [Lachnospiraceae bacterium]